MDFKDRKAMSSDHPLPGAKGAKAPTAGEHHPELARAMAKKKKTNEKKREERRKKTTADGKSFKMA